MTSDNVNIANLFVESAGVLGSTVVLLILFSWGNRVGAEDHRWDQVQHSHPHSSMAPEFPHHFCTALPNRVTKQRNGGPHKLTGHAVFGWGDEELDEHMIDR